MIEPLISVVIPTRDRRETLLETLAALDGQDLPAGAADIIVVDNGSRDDTLQALARRAPGRLPLRILTESRPGPAAARNRGWEAARGRSVLFLGDDMIPAGPGLVAGHLAHRTEPALGRVTWRPDRPVTPFMHWLEHGGPQFPFDTLPPGPVEPAKYLFTSNVSVPRALLEAVGGFDERFPFAAVEDAELGVRLQQRGATLTYDPALLVHHDHPQEPVAYMRRMERAGASAALLRALHPSDTTAALPGDGPRWALLRRAYPLLEVAVHLPWRGAVGARVWSAGCVAGYARGIDRAEALLPTIATVRTQPDR
jgi:glycosyltransferase involved in cell wall biosynthesis